MPEEKIALMLTRAKVSKIIETLHIYGQMVAVSEGIEQVEDTAEYKLAAEIEQEFISA
ncbi:hypothetical protein [Variovorax paradoxus]|jgi:hypothetical protein|uniref:hypothetical protein n=1 Tax=Variovorax paradoxus TaxID=34073 RepID=UPI000A9A3A8D